MITPSTDSEIHLLPEHIVDQIKAGEVIERPATLLKELIENSIDAHATKINIHIVNNGLDLISIEDNGKGMSFSDLPLAFCRHATSKISIFEDLYDLNSYGFRGEALASMASVSKLTCNSNQPHQPLGSIQFHGGQMISHLKDDSVSHDSGTKIYVKDLFFNTPVRMKFLQSQNSEKNQLKKIINAFVLTHPNIEFSVKWDDLPKDHFPKLSESEISDRVKKIFEKKTESLDLIDFSSIYDGVKVNIFLSHNNSKGNAGKFHYLFINNRYIQDTKIHKIILNSAQSLWPFGNSGNYVVFIDINPDQLDVNVHPNKTIVKLFQPSKVYSLLSSSIKQHLPKSEVHHMGEIKNTELNIESDKVDFKGINYGEKDFSQKHTLENYFNNLDQSQTQTQGEIDPLRWNFLLKTSDVNIVQKEDDLYLINNQRLIRLYINNLLNMSKDSSIPLLVSVPISATQKLESSFLAGLNNLGFELDYLSDEALVLRSFPKFLSDLPYQEVCQNLIKHKTLKLPENIHLDFNLTSNLFEKIISTFSIATLIELKMIKLIHPKDFLKLI